MSTETKPAVLKMTEVKHFRVAYGDLEHFLTQVYDLPKRVQLCYYEEWSNDSSHSCTIRPFFGYPGCTAEEALQYHQEEMETILSSLRNGSHEGLGCGITNTFLTDLALKGLIPYGEYLIVVCW